MSIWKKLFGVGGTTASRVTVPIPVDRGSLSLHRSERFHFTIRSPAKWEVIHRDQKQGDWTISVGWAGPEESEGRPGFLVNVRESEILNRNQNVTKTYIGSDGQSWTAPTSPQEYIALSKSSIPFPDLQHESESVVEFAGMEATQITYSYRGTRGRVRERVVTLFGMSATYQLVAEAPAARFNAWLPLFEMLISSFALGSEPTITAAVTPPKSTAAVPDSAIGFYNLAVDHFSAARFTDAEANFEQALRAPDAAIPVKMAAAYARAISLGQLRRAIEMPEEFADKSDATGCTYLAYTAAGHLVRDGHTVAIDGSVVDARIGRGLYRFAFSSFFGNFSILASRMEEGQGAIRVTELVAKSNPRKEDIYANDLLQKLSSGSPRPAHIPAGGFPESL